MTEKTVDLFDPNFKINHLTTKPTSHQIRSLKPAEKNIELRAIVLAKKEKFTTKTHATFYSFSIADQTGSMSANFFASNGRSGLTKGTECVQATSCTSTARIPRFTTGS